MLRFTAGVFLVEGVSVAFHRFPVPDILPQQPARIPSHISGPTK